MNNFSSDLASEGHQFFKLMLHGFKDQLRIPAKFSRRLKEELTNRVVLQGPSGKKWAVEVTSDGQEVFLQNGWDVFARENGLDYLDVLVFCYIGNSFFRVSIFDPSGCERECAFNVVKRMNPSKHSRIEEERVEIQETLFIGNNKESYQEVNSGCDAVKEVSEVEWLKGIQLGKADMDKVHPCGTSDVGDKKKNSSKVDGKTRNSKSSLKIQEKKDEFVQIIDDSDDEGHSHTKKKQTTENSRLIPLPDLTKKKNRKKKQANEIAVSHSSSKTFFQITIEHKNVCKDFTKEIPQIWAATHIPKQSQKIHLKVPSSKNKWKAQIKYESGKWKLGGWLGFVLDNDLKKDDVCFFKIVEDSSGEPSTSTNLILFNVYIHRAG